MKYSEKEIAARKQLAMAAANFFVNEGFDHVTVSITRTRAEVTQLRDFSDELEAAKKQVQPFIIDGASQKTGEDTTECGGHFYYLEMEWL